VNNTVDDGLITVKFIQLNDVYEIAPLSGGKYGGMARVAHIKDSIADENPLTYLFMAGDFMSPSLLGTLKLDGERIAGKQMIEVMNAMDFELVTFGNHEFDYTKSFLQKRLNESDFTWLSSNAWEVNEEEIIPFTMERNSAKISVKDSHILTLEDEDGTSISIGFFGVTIPSNPKPYVSYGDIFDESERVFTELTNRVDVVVGLTHVDISDDREIAKRLNKLPLIMGGHNHHNMLDSVENTIIAKADANAKTIYIHTLSYSTRTKKLDIDSYLMPVNEHVASKNSIKTIVDRWQKVLDEIVSEVIASPDEVIYYAKIPLDAMETATREVQTNLGAVISHAMSQSFNKKVDAAFFNGGSVRMDDILSGEITNIDIFRALPFGGQVIRVELKGKLLKKTLDFGESKKGSGAYLHRHNLTKKSNGGWLINGSEIEDEQVYTIATSDFLLKGFDIPFLKKGNKGVVSVYEPLESEAAWDIRKAVILYLKSLNQKL
jgi:5'-nucleotidase/UDP-sugar diphosphatase